MRPIHLDRDAAASGDTMKAIRVHDPGGPEVLRAARPRGIGCHTGLLGNAWLMERFEPLEDIPSTVRLTTYHSGTTSAERSTAALLAIVDGVAAGRYRANVERIFRFDEIVDAHRFMEENRGGGKLVVLVDA